MESLIAVIVAVGLILLAGLTVFERAIAAQTELTTTWVEVQELVAERSATELSIVDADVDNGGNFIDITLRNDGQTRLTDLERWDVLVQHYRNNNMYFGWYDYRANATSPGQWTSAGIYLDAASFTPEVFEPGILNPGEEMLIQIQLTSKLTNSKTAMITVGTPNGVHVSTFVTR